MAFVSGSMNQYMELLNHLASGKRPKLWETTFNIGADFFMQKLSITVLIISPIIIMAV